MESEEEEARKTLLSLSPLPREETDADNTMLAALTAGYSSSSLPPAGWMVMECMGTGGGRGVCVYSGGTVHRGHLPWRWG